MSGYDPATSRFFECSRAGGATYPRHEWITERLAAVMPTIVSQLPQHDSEAGSCPLTEVGDYLLRVLHIISQFSTRMAYGGPDGDFVDDYASSNLKLLVHYDDGSLTNYLDEKHQTLKYSFRNPNVLRVILRTLQGNRRPDCFRLEFVQTDLGRQPEAA
jgi:hypothetical protein